MKRGAVSVLWSAAARGACDPKLIPRLAKHVPGDKDFPAISVAYAGNVMDVAEALGTGALTMLL